MPTLSEWRAFYDGWAGRDPRLASTGNVMPDDDFARLGKVLTKWLDLRGDERVLDVGCASGTLTSQWATNAAAGVGVDFSQKLLDEATRRHAATNLTFQQAEAAALPFPDGTFDCVVSFNVLHSLPDHDYFARAIAEMQRVAKADSRIVLGSLPDERCQQRFFEVLQAEAPWWRRVGSRIKGRLRPNRARDTRILWFDVPSLQRQFERAGWHVEVHDDPPFANYRHYRKSLVLRRNTAKATR